MSRIYKLLMVAALVIGVAAGAPHAQHGSSPFVYITFDGALAQNSGYCKGEAVFDTLSVVAFNMSEPINGIKFFVQVDSQALIGLGDVTSADSTLGDWEHGIELFWNGPIYASEPTIIHRIQVLWLCADCDALSRSDFPVVVWPHPSTVGSFVEATRWPDGATINALGLPSLVCPTSIVGTQQSTWGAIKALYQ